VVSKPLAAFAALYPTVKEQNAGVGMPASVVQASFCNGTSFANSPSEEISKRGAIYD
jgi:hypothetical protein